MDQFQEKLSTMQENYAASKAQQEQLFGGAKVDPGVYEARLSSASLALSKKGNLQIKRTHIILTAGDFEGIPVTDYMQLETEYGFAFGRRWVELCGGVCPPNAKDFGHTIKAIADKKPLVRIEVRKDGDFTNVAVMELLGGEASAEENTEAAPEVSDDSLSALKAFAVAQDIEITDEDDLEVVKEKISAFNYESGKLSEDEVTLLTTNDLGGLIQYPEAKKPAAKVPAKKPASKPTPKKRK